MVIGTCLIVYGDAFVRRVCINPHCASARTEIRGDGSLRRQELGEQGKQCEEREEGGYTGNIQRGKSYRRDLVVPRYAEFSAARQ